MVERRRRDLRSPGIDGLGAAMSGIRPRARRFLQVNRPARYLLEVFQQVLPQHVGPPHQLHGRSHVSPLRFFRLLDERPDPFHSFPLRRSERFARSLLQCRPGTRETLCVVGFALAALSVRKNLAQLRRWRRWLHRWLLRGRRGWRRAGRGRSVLLLRRGPPGWCRLRRRQGDLRRLFDFRRRGRGQRLRLRRLLLRGLQRWSLLGLRSGRRRRGRSLPSEPASAQAQAQAND